MNDMELVVDVAVVRTSLEIQWLGHVWIRHDVCDNYEDRRCIRAELRKRKQKTSTAVSVNNNSDIGNKNTNSDLANETPLTNGFAGSGRTVGNREEKEGLCINRLGKEKQVKQNTYEKIGDEKALQSLLDATQDLNERILIRAAMRTLRQRMAKCASPVISQCRTACREAGDSNGDTNGHCDRPVTPTDIEAAVDCQTSKTTICLDDSNRWSLADYKKRKARNMEKHLNALSDNPLSTTKTTSTKDASMGITTEMNSLTESSNASSDSESPSCDTMTTREFNGSIRVMSRIRNRGDRTCNNEGFSLGKLIDNKIARHLSQEGNSGAGSSDCDSQEMTDGGSEEETQKEGEREPSTLDSLAEELKELENKLRSSRDFDVRHKLRGEIREIRALISELSSGLQTENHVSGSIATSTQPQQTSSTFHSNGETVAPGNSETVAPGNSETVAPGNSETVAPGNSETVAPGNSETVTPGNCETVVIEHHIPWEHVSHHRHSSPRASFLGDRDIITARSLSDNDKEDTTTAEQGEAGTAPPPRIFTPLVDQSVTVGQPITLECMVVNGDDASIRWFRDAEQLDPSEEFEHIFDGSVAKLVIKAVELEYAGTYRCVVQTTGGDTETSASVVVEAQRHAPEFIEQLADVSTQVGDDQVILQCRLCGLPLPRVTWYHNATLLSEGAGSSQSFDGDIAQLTLTPVSRDHTGEYQCVARNMSGETRTVCQLTVQEPPEAEPEETTPEFTAPLTDTHGDDGDTVTLQCCVIGQPTPDVTWYKDDKPLPNCTDSCQSFIDGVARLVFEDIVASSSGVYRCIAKNLAGEANSEANVTVAVPTPTPAPAQLMKQPIFLRPLEDKKITEGETLILECSVAANPAPSIDWFRNREPFEATPECSLSFDGTTAKLQIETITSKFSGMYKCVAKNSLGSARTLCNLSVKVNRSGRSTRTTETILESKSTGSDVTTSGDGIDGCSSGVQHAPTVTAPPPAVVTNIQTGSVNMGDTSDINNMEDEEKLHDLLSQTENFDERRKIRARLRAVREKKSEEWAQKRSEREAARVEANQLRQQQSEAAKQRKLKQYQEQAKDQRKGSGVVEEGLRRRVAEADAEKQRKLEQYKEIGKVMSAAYHAGSDMATRNAISVADKDKERRLQDFEEEAVSRTTSTEQLEDGSTTTTNTTVSTQRNKDGKTTTVRQSKQVTKVGGIGGTAYVTNRPGAEETARRLANTFAQRGYPQTSGLIRVKTESWSSQDGIKHRAQKACSWSGGPRGAMAAFKNMDAANGPAGRPNIGGGRVGVQRSASTIKQMLLDWCRSMTQEYENVDITNFSSSWNNGMAFCALIHHFFPNAFEYSKLNPKNRRFNFTLGFEVAEKFAGIAPLLDVEDMVRMKNPDWKCVFTTVQSYYRWYRSQENKKEGEVTSSSPAPVPAAAQ